MIRDFISLDVYFCILYLHISGVWYPDRSYLSARRYDYLNLSNNHKARHIPKENKGAVARQRTLIRRGFPGRHMHASVVSDTYAD
jgi:hypothetical protein